MWRPDKQQNSDCVKDGDESEFSVCPDFDDVRSTISDKTEICEIVSCFVLVSIKCPFCCLFHDLS